MNLTHLMNYITVAEELNLSVAAKKLYVAQPALSKQLRALEEEYGCVLIERTTGKMSITQAGRLLYERAVMIRDIESGTRAELSALAADKTETLRVGLTPLNSLGIFGEKFIAFREQHSEFRFNITENSSADIISGLRSGSVDIAIVNGRLYPYSDINVLLSHDYCYMAAFLPSAGFFSGDVSSLSLKELSDKPLCVSKRYEDEIKAAVGNGAFMNIAFSLSYLDRGIQLVKSGLAVAILPGYAAEDFRAAGAHVVPLSDDIRITRYLLTAHGRPESAAVTAFCDYCREIL